MQHWYGYFLQYGLLSKKPKKKDRVPLQVVRDACIKVQVLKEFYDSDWTGYRGV